MTLRSQNFTEVRKTLLAIREKNPKLTVMEMALDMGISPAPLYNVFRYKRFRPGKWVETRIREYIERLKQKYPEDCPQEVIRK